MDYSKKILIKFIIERCSHYFFKSYSFFKSDYVIPSQGKRKVVKKIFWEMSKLWDQVFAEY